MELFLLGANHITAPAGVRDDLFMDRDDASAFLRRFQKHNRPVTNLVVLSTCNRTEFYGATPNLAQADQGIREAVVHHKGVAHMQNGDYTYVRSGRDAARHLFRVASGLDSMMVGEAQILGQVKNAWAVADHCGTPGPY